MASIPADITRYQGRVTERYKDLDPRGPSLTISLDELYNGCTEFTTTARVAREADQRGVAYHKQSLRDFQPR